MLGRSWLVASLFALALAGCGATASPGALSSDGGVSGPDGGGADAGRPKIVWPEASFTLEDAADPSLVKAPSGALTLVYQQGGKLWAHRDPPAGAPVELASASGFSLEVSVAASPTEDRIFVAWTGRSGVSLTGGVPDSASFQLIDGIADLSNPGAGWFDGGPVLSAYTNQVYYDGTNYPSAFLAFAVPLDPPRMLPEASASQKIIALANPYHHHQERHRFLDLGGGKALLFETHWDQDPADPSGEGHAARWHLLKRHRDAGGAATGFLVPERTGHLPLPKSAAAWIQPHELGGGRYALTWGSLETSLVYDVTIAGLAIAADGTPSLTTAPVNVSMTSGVTQNSDHPLVRPTGDGRYWLVWRETDYGPRVALLDGVDFRVRALGAPARELTVDESSGLGAQVDAEGTLHLVAAFRDGDGQRVRCFRIALP